MMWKRFEVSVLVLAGLALGLSGCSRDRAQAKPKEARNVVLISMDTCRADRLSCYGYSRPTTPNIDAVAGEGVLFENAISPNPSTLPAHCSMLTGTTPPYHGVHANNSYRLPASNHTLAELLKKEGYTTAAFVSTFMLDAQFGLDQGFDTYNDDLPRLPGMASAMNQRAAGLTNAAVFPWLDQHAEERFFLMVHYYDAHAPYYAPEPFRTQYADDRYAGEIAYMDQQIGALISKLKALGLYDSTLLIITADHGEGLGDHGEYWHGFFVYHETTKVPLIIKPPGGTTAARIEEKVGLIDIVPTVLAAVGASDAPDMEGRDLSPFLYGKKSVYRDRLFYSESLVPTLNGCNALFAVEDQSWKYIQSRRPELYDLASDPGEKNNLFAKDPKRAVALQSRLQQTLAAATRTSGEDAKVALDPASQAKLASLGYLGGFVNATLAFETDKIDPKDFVKIHEQLVMVTDLQMRGNVEGVERLCNEILKVRPDVARAHEAIGIVTPAVNIEKRLYHFLETLKYDPHSVEAHFGLGNVYGRKGKLLEAETYFREAARLAEGADSDESPVKKTLIEFGRVHPALFKARLHLADTLAIQLKREEAIEVYYNTLYLDPFIEDSAEFRLVKTNAFCRLGDILRVSQRFEDAVNAYQDALALTPGFEYALHGIDLALSGSSIIGGP